MVLGLCCFSLSFARAYKKNKDGSFNATVAVNGPNCPNVLAETCLFDDPDKKGLVVLEDRFGNLISIDCYARSYNDAYNIAWKCKENGIHLVINYQRQFVPELKQLSLDLKILENCLE